MFVLFFPDGDFCSRLHYICARRWYSTKIQTTHRTTNKNLVRISKILAHRAHMKLTIKNLQYGDFGNYRCISKNSLGETEGSIRVYGKRFIYSFLCMCSISWDDDYLFRTQKDTHTTKLFHQKRSVFFLSLACVFVSLCISACLLCHLIFCPYPSNAFSFNPSLFFPSFLLNIKLQTFFF